MLVLFAYCCFATNFLRELISDVSGKVVKLISVKVIIGWIVDTFSCSRVKLQTFIGIIHIENADDY